jgi:hypothetical protein
MPIRTLVASSARSPAAAHHLAEDLLGQAAGVDIGGVDQVHPGVQAHVHLAPGLVYPGGADVGEGTPPAEGHRAHGQHRHPQTRLAQRAIFHAHDPTRALIRPPGPAQMLA